MLVPQQIENKVTSKVKKQRFCFVEYTSAKTKTSNEVVLTEHAIVYILSGQKKIYVEGSEYTINAGELFLAVRGSYVMSEYLPATGDEFRSIMFFFNTESIVELLHLCRSQTFSKHLSFQVQTLQAPKRLQLFYEHVERFGLDNHYLFAKELLTIKVKELFYILLSETLTKSITLLFMSKVYYMSKHSLVKIVNDNIYNKVTIETLAHLSCKSVSTFKRAFVQEFKMSPIAWIINKRLERARFLLLNTEKPVAEIAQECGFDTYAHFARSFKNKYNISALQFRSDMQ